MPNDPGDDADGDDGDADPADEIGRDFSPDISRDNRPDRNESIGEPLHESQNCGARELQADRPETVALPPVVDELHLMPPFTLAQAPATAAIVAAM